MAEEVARLVEDRNCFKRTALDHSKKVAELKEANRKLKKEVEELREGKELAEGTVKRLVGEKPVEELRGALLQAQLAGLKNYGAQLSNRLREVSRLSVELESQYDRLESMAD